MIKLGVAADLAAQYKALENSVWNVVANNSMLLLPRYYTGPDCPTYSSNSLAANVEPRLLYVNAAWEQRAVELLKSVIEDHTVTRDNVACMSKLGQSGRTWRNTNWLDTWTVRIHLVVSGKGVFRQGSERSLSYAAGDVLLFDNGTIDADMTHDYKPEPFMYQQVLCIGSSHHQHIKNWDLMFNSGVDDNE